MEPSDNQPPMALWAQRFMEHWRDELREPCDVHDILDWAYELYPTKGMLRPEEVAQAECQALQPKA